MPLVRIDVIQGRSKEQTSRLLDALHEAMLEAFNVPAGDRYQILTEHPAALMVVQDTGLNIPRTQDVVVIQVTTRPRTTAEKEAFYRLAVKALDEQCGISPSDVVISCVTNTDEDWSFGHGRAQFLTGEL
ncbi:tautomerase family protein [Burkholderia multivorans]|uniref:tautomerase family protein n=1 Tax=Burkholderia multivorans TaxID=87883 RepID=UPI001C25141C|nr:tautomerase family protein [Burkholderia multivorans]MBU9477662.1 tautomerase family protein [Burkholderia multivorans]